MWTRDHPIWTVLFTIGLAVAGALMAGNPADYGLSPVQFKWLQLLATGLVAAGKLGNSPLRGENDRQVSRTSLDGSARG